MNHKLSLKGTSKITLHERFTQLSKIHVPPVSDTWDSDISDHVPRGSGVSRYGRGASEGLLRRPNIGRQTSPTIIRPTSMPTYRERSVDTERMLYRPSAAVMAANKLKRRSIQQRLGVKARLSLPRYRPGAGLMWGGGRRWGSTESLNNGSNNMGRR